MPSFNHATTEQLAHVGHDEIGAVALKADDALRTGAFLVIHPQFANVLCEMSRRYLWAADAYEKGSFEPDYRELESLQTMDAMSRLRDRGLIKALIEEQQNMPPKNGQQAVYAYLLCLGLAKAALATAEKEAG